MEPNAGAALGFAGQAFRGKSGWWRYVLAIGLFMGGAFGFARLLAPSLFDFLVRVASAAGYREGFTAATFGLYTAVYAVLLGLMLTVFPLLHQRGWRSFVTARARVDVALVARSFAVMIGLCLATLGIDLYFSASDMKFNAEPSSVLRFAPVVLVFLPVQCLAEEVLFRGYVAQAVGRLTRSTALRIALPALLFGAAHFDNPEMSIDRLWVGADYLLAGLYLGLVSLKGRGLEASFGLHLANNVFTMLIAGTTVGVLHVPALWTASAPDARLGFLSDIVLYLFHFCLVFRPWERVRR
jgi:membrane protease YdiL (CAAX protease family)